MHHYTSMSYYQAFVTDSISSLNKWVSGPCTALSSATCITTCIATQTYMYRLHLVGTPAGKYRKAQLLHESKTPKV